jgi:hypothetical protein
MRVKAASEGDEVLPLHRGTVVIGTVRRLRPRVAVNKLCRAPPPNKELPFHPVHTARLFSHFCRFPCHSQSSRFRLLHQQLGIPPPFPPLPSPAPTAKMSSDASSNASSPARALAEKLQPRAAVEDEPLCNSEEGLPARDDFTAAIMCVRRPLDACINRNSSRNLTPKTFN